MKKAILNLSTPKFYKGQTRLAGSLISKTDAHLHFYSDEEQAGAPPHSEMPYAFKAYAFDKARSEGYDIALWLDASMYVLKDLTPLFEEIERTGYFFQDSGWMNDRWTTPEQEKYFGTNKGRMISAGVMGLDLSRPLANLFLYRWLRAAEAGMFKGSHDVTRHDQTAASLIIEFMGLKITDNNTFWTYGKPDAEYPDNILIVADGIC